jgi:hypothetical protein
VKEKIQRKHKIIFGIKEKKDIIRIK